jgi:hypothetical protein
VGSGGRDLDLVAIGRRLFTSTAARDWPQFIELIHPDAEMELRSQPGRIIRGRAEMEAFARQIIERRWAHEINVEDIEQIDTDAVVAVGRLFFSDERGIHDIAVGWLMLFEDGMLRQSISIQSMREGREKYRLLRAQPLGDTAEQIA